MHLASPCARARLGAQMTGTQLLCVLFVALIAWGTLESYRHRQNLKRIRIRIHVNGTRGKSSVTRLIAAALREAGLVTCAKTTGTLARMILPDAREVPIFRPAGPNVIEQGRIVAAAAAYKADALVVECMALLPELQSLCEFKMVRATHAVITNARPDHLDVMGPDEPDVAKALCGMIPPGQVLVTAEKRHLDTIRQACTDRRTRLVALDPDALGVSEAEMARLPFGEHPDNVAVALAVCKELDIEREVALRGMERCRPDPGAYTECTLDFFGRVMLFCNAFAANDPISTAQIWNKANLNHPELKTRIAIFNCRADRPDRSLALGKDFVHWSSADHVVLMGTGTYLMANTLTAAGYDASRLVFAEGLTTEEIFERLVSLVDGSALLMGMGNVGGLGLELARHFKNRAQWKAA